ncbi:MAG TPA: type II secretion system F family protein [Actinomycetota bacterium]|nr:type II secretion system F family protein [Actinomycetota bacterium]
MSVLVALAGAAGLVLVFDGLGARAPSRGRRRARIDALLSEAGVRTLSARGLAALCATGWTAAFVVVAGATGSLSVAVASATAVAWSPVAWLRTRRARRRGAFREAWPDALAATVSAVRAGVSLGEACVALAQRGPRELRPAFASFSATYWSTGSFRAALDRLRDELADPVGDRVVAALALAHDVGGTDLVRVLRTLGDFVREDLRVRKEIEARWSWTVTAARVAAAAPWIVLLLMSTRAETARAYDSPTGVVVLGVGAAATFAGYRLMLAAARLPDERRLGP